MVYCHEKGIVHRDLKPENVMIDHEQNDIIKIIDFGTSVTYQRGVDVLQGVFGTAYYIAPEICKRMAYDERCDVWTIGVMIYILLCGSPPFDDPKDGDDDVI